jgi:hypothetical protein
MNSPGLHTAGPTSLLSYKYFCIVLRSGSSYIQMLIQVQRPHRSYNRQSTPASNLPNCGTSRSLTAAFQICGIQTVRLLILGPGSRELHVRSILVERTLVVDVLEPSDERHGFGAQANQCRDLSLILNESYTHTI